MKLKEKIACQNLKRGKETRLRIDKVAIFIWTLKVSYGNLI